MLLRLAVGLIFIVVPVLELMLLIRIGQSIGVVATVALVLATALTGAYIISRQGLSVVTRTLEAASQGRPPVEPVLDALFLLVAGALLVTPGLITDFFALALLVPPVRRAVARAAVRWLLRRANVRVTTYRHARGSAGRGWGPGAGPERTPPPAADLGDGPVIEGEFEDVDEPPSRRGQQEAPPDGPRRAGGPRA